MARSNIPMVINLRQNKNAESAAYGKYFAEVDAKEPLNLKGFAKHMTSHGKIADYQMCVLVLGQVVDCMSELLSQGQPVKLDGLGIFYPSILNKKGGAATAEEFNGAQHIKGVRFRFTPDSTDLDDLTTKAFGKKVTFGNGYYQEESGKKAPMIPLAAAEEPEP